MKYRRRSEQRGLSDDDTATAVDTGVQSCVTNAGSVHDVMRPQNTSTTMDVSMALWAIYSVDKE